MRAKLLAVTLFAVGLTGYLRANLADAAVAPHVLSSSAQSADDPPTEVEIKPLFFAPKPADDGRPAFLPRTEELACNACNAEIVTEWASSMHAMAWVDERYQKAIARKSKPESCQGCHIPEPLFSGDLERKPAPRADPTSNVVSNACHVECDRTTVALNFTTSPTAIPSVPAIHGTIASALGFELRYASCVA